CQGVLSSARVRRTPLSECDRASSWLDSWARIGHVAVGMARKGHDLRLTRYGRKEWGTEHSPTSARATICYPQSGRLRGCKKHSRVRDENRSSWNDIDWRHHGRIANPLSKMSRPRGPKEK